MTGDIPRKRRPRRDFGRLFARLLCAVFALIGALPLAAGLLVRSKPVLRWASAETARVLHEELGVEARYQVRMELWPLAIGLDDVVVPANDGGPPVLVADHLSVKPRVFSLLAGRLDVGDIEIEKPTISIVLRDGKLANLSYRLPKREGPAPKMERAPFSSLGVTDAKISLDIDGRRVNAGPIDLDVFAETGQSFEIGVRAAETRIVQPRPVTITADGHKSAIESSPERSVTFDAWDEDVVCRLSLRARVEPGSVLVRRLSLLGRTDFDPAQGTDPSCTVTGDEDPAKVALRLSQVRLAVKKGEPLLVDGHVVLRAPVAIANRYVKMGQMSGWVGFAGDVRYDARARLPEVRGKLHAENFQLDVYALAKQLDADVEVSGDKITIPKLENRFADGKIVVKNARIDPFAKGGSISAERVDGSGVRFPGLMRDLGVTNDTIVAWDLDVTKVTKVHGRLSPLKIDADLYAETRNFEVTNKSFRDPARRHMIGVHAATVRGRLGVRPNALEFYDTRSTFGKSAVIAKLVSIGFSNDIDLEIGKGSHIDLADVSPLIDIPWSGLADLEVAMHGKSGNPLLTGDLGISKLVFGGFPLGDIKSGKVRFSPLKVDFFDVVGKKNGSEFRVSTARLDFDTDSSVRADAQVRSDHFDVRDFFSMFLFDGDPRFDQIEGVGKVDARVHYDLGGKKDRCGGGLLLVKGDMDLGKVNLFEERYDSARADFDFRWLDRDASYLGIELDVPSVTLTKGTGTMLGSFAMQKGGVLTGQVVASGVPISKIDSAGALGMMVDGKANGTADVSGTVDALELAAQVHVSPVRMGTATLPASDVRVRLEPIERPLKVIGRTRCGGAITPPFVRAEYDQDKSQGTFLVSGAAFGGQIRMNDLSITRQRAKTVKGTIEFDELDVGSLAELSPSVALSGDKPHGTLSGSLVIDELPMETPSKARGKLAIQELEVEKSGLTLELLPGSHTIALADGQLKFPTLTVSARMPRGLRAVFDVKGTVSKLGKKPEVDANLTLRPLDLATLARTMPRVERVQGRLAGKLAVRGPLASPRYEGGFALSGGEIFVRGMPSPVSDLNVALDLSNDELRLSRATAKIGNGTLSVTGSAPLRGFELGQGRAVITARDLSLPLQQGMRAAVDANLVATYTPPSDGAEKPPLPRVTGDVTFRSFEYTRPITMTADINTLTQRGKRTEFEAYDPADDFVEFDVTLRANRALSIKNNLVEAELTLDRTGLQLAGTNERFGMRGEVRVKPGGRIRLRRNEFEVRQGFVRFDDVTRIAPQVDVTAVTDYRRYSESVSKDSGSGGGAADSTGSGSTAAQGGLWHISMHAHGDAENLKIDLTSDPALAQDDIFLLLTVGLTRAELDQAQSASVGESVALEALGTLSGADRAVTKAVPVIDEFRFGSAYSSRTGRTEPTVTIGKRLAERIRANVTSGLADSREIRSNIEWRLSNRVSVEGSYDNVNDISSSSLGNLGADIRWRLEFE
ncbi:MAG: translocation/assembly module TamB domain-containing protein [Polyangiaceae bacterium]|nr:translocation/assembly module TamB domain-containing protein [Polyangiaceae bacterium]